MTKNNLKVVKTDNKKQQELKEKNKSLEAAISQIDQNFGLIVIDDASNTIHPSDLKFNLEWLGNRLTLIRNYEKKGRMVNHIEAVSQFCKSKDSLITVLDLDDALFGNDVNIQLNHLHGKHLYLLYFF